MQYKNCYMSKHRPTKNIYVLQYNAHDDNGMDVCIFFQNMKNWLSKSQFSFGNHKQKKGLCK